jgi:trans-aconitate methyltransferase
MRLGWGASDWDKYWTNERLPRLLIIAQRKWVSRILKFGRIKNLDYRTVADVGCGPALALFELAKKLPGISFYGYDISTAVIRKNRNRARRHGLRNLAFDKARLPEVPRQHRFDLILCIATLHYILKNTDAIKNLYGILKPGGVLIFNYPNRHTMFWYRKNSDEAMKARFALLISGKNVLTQAGIEKALGTPCHNFWREMGETLRRANPCVYASRVERSRSISV